MRTDRNEYKAWRNEPMTNRVINSKAKRFTVAQAMPYAFAVLAAIIAIKAVL